MYDLVYRDRALSLPAADALVVADVHLGRAAASAVSFPLDERGDLRRRLVAHLDAVAPETVVFAGDVVHRFDRVTERTRAGLDDLLAACRNAGATPVLVAGNHDTALGAAWDGPLHDAYRLDDVVVCHGHVVPDVAGEASLYVVGHDHPVIDVEGRTRPCFLYGPDAVRGSDVVMLPSFTRLAGGATVNRMRATDFDSPFVTDADSLRPVVYDADADEALSFPPLGEFRHLL